ncbi:MAG: TIM barrel protein, partial [Chlamydiia bacterium]|nr:TIM barrel protein [Chlamydiia bacterium]
MSHLRIACNPLCWMNSDIPTLGSHIPVEQCLSEISMIGYAGVELEDPLRDALQLRPHILRERHLDLVAAWHGTRLLERSLAEEVEALKRHIDLIYPLGARVINVAEVSHSVHREPGTGLSCRPRPTESQWDLLAERLDRLVELMEEAGMRSAYHHHMGCLVQTEEDIDSLMQRTERVELLLDTGHLFYAGGDALRVIEKHGARIRHVHAKNVRKGIVQRLLAEDA